RVGYASQEYQSYKFFESLFINNLYNLGRAFASILYGSSFARRSMNLLGDPEMPVWTAKPRALAVILPENITTKPANVTAYVVDASDAPPWPPVANALVTFSKGDEVYTSAVTNENGQAQVHIYPETPGNISVVASKQNYSPARDVLPVIASSEPALSYANHRIDDDQAGGSNGNGNGSADAGETIELPLALKNFGNSTAYSVSARLSSDSPYITITDAEERWPDIPTGKEVWCEEDFDFVVAPDTPNGTTVTFHLDISSILPDGRPLSWSDTFYITVHTTILTHVGHKVNDTNGGNGNGILEPNETAEIPVLVRNSGGTEVGFAMAEMESLSPGIVVVQSSVHFHNIPPRSERWNCPFVNFVIQTTAEYLPGDMVRVTISDDLGHVFHSDFDFKRIGPPSDPQLIPGQGCIELRWSKAGDALGYHVYRRLAGETDFVRVDDELLTTATLFVDYNLPAGQSCEYRVTAVNATYNESTLWVEASGYTNPTFANGWPREVGSNGIEGSSPAVGNVYGSEDQVVVCATDNYIYVWNADGSLVPGWPKPLPMPNSGTPTMNNASPALANLDDDPQLEIVVAAGKYAYVWNGDGSNMPGWPQEMAGVTMASASIGDIDKDGAFEIIASSASPPYVYAWNADGSLVPGWPVTIQHTEDWIRTTAALADVDADGYPEVIVGTLDTAYEQSEVYVWKGNGQLLPYWPQSVSSVIWCAPVVGDIDGDCRNEIIVANMQNQIYAWHGDGTPQEGSWPANVGSSVANACALADLDGDGTLEILAGLGSGYITALRHDGTPLAGWPVYTEQGPVNSPSVADLDSDGSQEIVVPSGDYDGHLHLLRADGSKFPGSPYVTGGGMTSAPTIADLNSLVNPEPLPKAEIAIGALDRLVYIWSLPWRYDPANAQWPTFMHDFRRTGSYGPDRTGQPVPIDHILTVKYFPDGAWVSISCKVVTAGTQDFAGALYIEEPDRSSGIRVEPIDASVEPISRWQIVSVTGYLATVGGERAIVNATVELCGESKVLRPLAMSNLRLGGGPVGRFTPGVYPKGTGPNNTGLLVTSYGRVTWVSPNGDRLYIDDGSELEDGSGHKGVWISLEELADGNVIVPPQVGAYVSVTGISSCGYGPAEPPVRILKPRSQDDIRIYG
ncbi:MAG: FG-GAP-like repeat-containing protein, partial [Armatimonadota bacterium]